MKNQSLLQSSLLPLDSVKLGRLVTNAKNPQQDYLDPLDSVPEATIKSQETFHEILNSSRNEKLRFRLTALLAISSENQAASSATLSAVQATTYQLTNSGSWFRKACAKQETRSWFEEAIEENDVYLVVGYHTVTDARVTEGIITKGKTGGSAELSGSLLTGEAAPVVNLLSARIDSSHDSTHHQARSFRAPGEQIYAVQYRKVEFKWLSSRSIDKTTLERNNRWKIFWSAGLRKGGDDEFEGEDDVVEADLAEELDFGSLETYLSADGTEEFMF